MGEITSLLSIVAIFISITSLFLSIKTFIRDNPDLRVSLLYWPQAEKEWACFNVRVINHGRRIARVERISVYFSHAEPLLGSIAGGKPVNEVEPFDYQLHIYGVDGVPHHIPTDVKFVEVYDTLGKRYRYPRTSLHDWLEFQQLKKKIREQWDKAQIS